MAPGGSPPRSPRSPGIAAMRSLGRVSSPGMDRNAAFLQFKAGAGQQLNQVGSANTAHRVVAATRPDAALHVPGRPHLLMMSC